MMVKIATTILLFFCLFLVQICIVFMVRYEIPLEEFFQLKIIIQSLLISIGAIWLNSYLVKKGNALRNK